jgi:hypothetical protein
METATLEAPAAADAGFDALSSAAEIANDGDSFTSALEAAFSKFEAEPRPTLEVEPAKPKQTRATKTKAAVVETPTETSADDSTDDTGDIADSDDAPDPTAALDENDPTNDLDDKVDDWTPKAAKRFQQLKAELKTHRSELETLRQQRTEYESKIQELSGIAESKDLEALQAQLATYQQEQMFHDLEGTPVYQEAVTAPLQALLAVAEGIADKYELDTDAFIDILAMSDAEAQEEKLNEALANASDRDKAKVYRIIEDIDPILRKRQELHDNVEEAMAEAKLLEESKSKQAAADRARERDNVSRVVVDRIKEKLPFLAGIEGLDLKAIQAKAAAVDPSVAHPVDHAYNVVAAQLLPVIVRERASLEKEVEALTERLAAYEEAEPGVSGTTPGHSGDSVSDKLSFEERVNARLGL